MNAEERRNEIASRRRASDRTDERLWCRGHWRQFQVWQVPVSALALNIDNRRFIAEKKLMESKLGRPLDPENVPDDEKSIIAILLDTNLRVRNGVVVGTPTSDYQELRRDWMGRNQESPFWIRPDGTVRNGNRRLAMVKRLREETGNDAYEWVDACIFEPDDVDERELFEMEQREQQTENFKVRYTDVNLLLSIKAAAELRGIDWNDPDSLNDIAGQMQQVAGGDQTYALIQLRAIKYMDLFLVDEQAEGEYHKLRGQVERFRDVGKIMFQVESDYPDDAVEVLRVLFAAVRAGNPHGEIRQLGKMFRDDRERFLSLLGRLEEAEAEWQEGTPALEDPDIEGEGDEEEDDNEPGPNVPDYPADEVKTLVKNEIDGMRASSDTDVASILEQAHNRLEALTDDRGLLSAAIQGDAGDEIRGLLAAVVSWADAAKTHLQ